jgi:predicted nuclease with RNAse H fold
MPRSALGIDLASRNVRTAAALLTRGGNGSGSVEILEVDVSDQRILELSGRADATGIDAPFGWPDGLRRFLDHGPPADGVERGWFDGARNEVFLRATDRFVWQKIGKKPLVVAADLIAYPALRCAGLLAALGITDRSGADGVFEVYPAATLIQWAIPIRRAASAQLAAAVVDRFPGLEITNEQKALLESNRDALDAVVAALSTLAAADGASCPIPEELRDRARREGWIHIPDLRAPAGLGACSE